MADKNINGLQEKTVTSLYIPSYDISEAGTEKLKKVSAINYGIPIYDIGSPSINMTVMNGLAVPIVMSGGVPKARVSPRDLIVSIHSPVNYTFSYAIMKSGGAGWGISSDPTLPYVEYTCANQGVNFILVRLSYVNESDIDIYTIAETYVMVFDGMGYCA